MKTKFNRNRPILFLAFLVGFVFAGYGQNDIRITGKVLGADSGPLPGASVVEKGTQNGVQTDFDGVFELFVGDPNAVVSISYVGFVSQEISLEGNTEIEVTLTEDLNKLEEVVVIAYGEQKVANVSGALAKVGDEAIEGQAVGDFQNALQGQVAGLTIVSNSGAPGGQSAVVIRGAGSISGGNQPLYVKDGNIMHPFIGNQGPNFTNPDPLSTISPGDIESITVLKDASASAIYGARAANGVILITTKRGKTGKARFDLDMYTGFQEAWNTLDLLNTDQYQQVMNNARDNAGAQRIPALDGTTLTTYTDWQKEVLQTAPISNIQFRASGGGENTTYSASLGYFDQNGIVIETGMKRYNLNLNTDSTLGKFHFGTSVNLSRTIYDKEKVGSARTVLDWAIVSAPHVPVYDENNLGGYAGPGVEDGEPTTNPVAIQNLVDNTNTVNRILGSVFADYEIVEGLKFKINAGFDLINFHDRRTVPDFELNQNQVPGFEQGAEVSEYRGENNSFLLENTLNYKRSFGKHNLDAIIGYNIQETHFADMRARVLGQFTGGGLPVLSGSRDISAVSGIISESKTTSFIGRVIYDYNEKYLATFNFRRDGSSKFVGDKQYDNFFAASAGWRISKEDFMKDSFISDLKLRVSYGALGNDAINANSARFTLNQNATYVLGINQDLAPGVGPAGSMQNSDLGWERQTQLDIGVDFGLADNRFMMTIDYFDKKSEDLLLTIPVPGHTGFNNITINAGEVTNKGWEFSASWRDFVGDNFTYSIGANLTTLKNEVTQLTEGLDFIETSAFGQLSSVQRVRIEAGQPLNSFYGYQVDGVFQSDQEVADAPYQSDLTGAGDFRYKDLDGNGVIDANDRTFIGDGIPDVTYGINIGMGYKNWDFSALMQGVAGVDIWSETKFFTQSYPRTNNQNTVVLNAWTPQNPSETIPRALPQPLSDNDRVSDFFIEDGSYFRLKNVQLGYSFPQHTRDRMGGLTKFRLYFSGQNLFTITGYDDVGFDPEIGANGIDNVVYPQARAMTLGLQIGF